LGIQTLAGIARNSTADAARVSAAQALLDRGWGKPQQDGNVPGEIRVTLRKMLGGADRRQGRTFACLRHADRHPDPSNPDPPMRGISQLRRLDIQFFYLKCTEMAADLR
jgi:hypothetical protein